MLSFNEAISKLAAYMENPGSLSPQILEHLVSEVSIDDPVAGENATSYFYCGRMNNGVSTSVWASEFAAKNGEGVRILNHTAAFRFLGSPEFQMALTRALENSQSAITATEFMHNPKTGQLAQISTRFANNTVVGSNAVFILPHASL